MSHTQVSCQIRSIDNVQNGMLEWLPARFLVKRRCCSRRIEVGYVMEVNDYGYDGTCGVD